MTTEETNNNSGIPVKNDTKLSIQVSLNGLSLCVLDTATNTVLKAEKAVFAKKLTPYGLLKRLKALFSEHDIELDRFSEVVVVHRNNLFGFVPRPLFDADELANYLKFNTKILVNDHMAYDEIEGYDMVNVFVPFINVNNYIYEGFGAFTFKHNGTVMIESLPVPALPDGQAGGKEPVCYVHIFERQMDIAVVAQRKLLLFNSFDFVTKEDFLYYLLFTMEQLQLDKNAVAVKLFGDIEEGGDLYELCYRYVLNVAIIVPAFSDRVFENTTEETLDFTVLNAL
jgi:hypothetical protein